MARPKGSTSDAHERLLAAAGRGFRSGGYGGIGVDGLAKEAGLTSGAFYAYFGSKAEAFRQAVRAGIADLASGIRTFREGGGDWRSRFIAFYTTERVTCDPAESCALQSLTVDVARADAPTREDYTAGLEQAISALAEAPDPQARAAAIALLALLSGGTSMARAVSDPALAEEIADAVRAAAETLAAR
jgi:TetR/AcrR family transcriptional regulator, transcriptional repressor for nem operon